MILLLASFGKHNIGQNSFKSETVGWFYKFDAFTFLITSRSPFFRWLCNFFLFRPSFLPNLLLITYYHITSHPCIYWGLLHRQLSLLTLSSNLLNCSPVDPIE